MVKKAFYQVFCSTASSLLLPSRSALGGGEGGLPLCPPTRQSYYSLMVKSHTLPFDVVDVCKENAIILFCLLPHTTRALQSWGVSMFRSLKGHFSGAIRTLFSKKNVIVTKKEFSQVLKSPFEHAFLFQA